MRPGEDVIHCGFTPETPPPIFSLLFLLFFLSQPAGCARESDRAPSDRSALLSLPLQSHSSHLSGLYGVPPASAIAHQNPVRLPSDRPADVLFSVSLPLITRRESRAF